MMYEYEEHTSAEKIIFEIEYLQNKIKKSNWSDICKEHLRTMINHHIESIYNNAIKLSDFMYEYPDKSRVFMYKYKDNWVIQECK